MFNFCDKIEQLKHNKYDIMFFKYPHFENIHKYIFTNKNQDNVFNSNVCITQKIDGSNLSIHICKENNDFVSKHLIGRNHIIWKQESKEEVISYAGYKNINKIINNMKDFSVKLCNVLKTDDIIVCGELYNVKNLSWHPFNYALYDTTQKEYKLQLLTKEIYDIFNQITPTYDNIQHILQTTKENMVFPPPLLYFGKLNKGIDTLFNLMNSNDKTFEGCFIVFDDNTGCKWKTRLYDEQPKIPKLADLFIFDNKDSYNKLMIIFEKEENKVVKKEQNKQKQVESTIYQDIIKTYNHEQTKNKDNQDINFWNELIYNEIIDKYKSSNVELPYNIENLKNKINIIMKAKLTQKI